MLKAGDYIQCADAEEMAQYMTDLERMGIQADFDFSHGERIKIFGPGWIRRSSSRQKTAYSSSHSSTAGQKTE